MRWSKQACVLVLVALVSVGVFVALCMHRKHGRVEGYERPTSVLILMYSTPAIMDYASLAARINEMYAKRHGYSFKHVIGDDNDSSMRPVWKKVHLVRDELRNYDCVFWIDSDAIFNNHEKQLPLNTHEEFLISSDWPNGPSLVNTGTFLVKNTAFGRMFMDRWASMMTKVGSTYNTKFPYEQGACEDLIRSLGNESTKTRVLPAEGINSIFGKVSRGQFDGLFIIHLMACPAPYRIKIFNEWLKHNNVSK